VLKWDTNRFISVTVQYAAIDYWFLDGSEWELVGDFDGDGRDEIYIRRHNVAGVLELVGNQLRLSHLSYEWIDDWTLGRDNTEFVGRFTQTTKDEIMIRSPQWIGLLYWDSTQNRLRLKSIQHDSIGAWRMGASDQHTIGDFDGDGRDEIYIRSPSSAGVIKWQVDRFRLLWSRQNDLQHMDGDPAKKIVLRTGDKICAGRFLPDRDGVLHRYTNGLAVLTWESNEMRIRHHLPSPFNGKWNLGSDDKFVLGDFHRLGRDIGDPGLDYIQDGLTDVFIHSTSGTGMVAVNHAQWDPARPDIQKEIGLTWINMRELLTLQLFEARIS